MKRAYARVKKLVLVYEQSYKKIELNNPSKNNL
jgi:hypothetical protein